MKRDAINNYSRMMGVNCAPGNPPQLGKGASLECPLAGRSTGGPLDLLGAQSMGWKDNTVVNAQVYVTGQITEAFSLVLPRYTPACGCPD